MASTEIKFRRDTSFRKALFSPDSFAHPAKMDAQLLLWIVERYTKAGDTILDPMAGSGTAMLGCTVGRNIIQVELEQKFVDMQKTNWDKVRMMPQLGHKMGECYIIQGDARHLEGLIADIVITSPPYTNRMDGGMRGSRAGMVPYTDEAPDSWFTQRDQKNIGNLTYGDIDSIVTSPPYADQLQRWGNSETATMKRKHLHQESKEGIGSLQYGQIDEVITSPPYESQEIVPGRQTVRSEGLSLTYPEAGEGYNRDNAHNIGNLKSGSYLHAMLQVYEQCHKVLKPNGAMVIVTKNFIRNRREVRLDEDTIRLCEQVGFKFVERHYRKLPAQSFWRVIYQQKYPEAPVLDKEDILVFRKEGAEAPI